MLGVVAAEEGYRGPEGKKRGSCYLITVVSAWDSLRRSMGVYLRIEITLNRVLDLGEREWFAFLFVGVVRNVLELAYAVEVAVRGILSNSTAWG